MKEVEVEKERLSAKHKYVRKPLMGGGGDLNIRELQGTMNVVCWGKSAICKGKSTESKRELTPCKQEMFSTGNAKNILTFH